MSATCRPADPPVSAATQPRSQTRPETHSGSPSAAATRGLVDRDSFLKLPPAAQANLLRQTLLLYLTALELANRNPDDWEAAAFTAALDHLAAGSPLRAYDEAERMLLPPSQRSHVRRGTQLTTGILRVETGADGQRAPAEKLDRNGMRRRLLQLSAIQLPSLDPADARRSVMARARRRHDAGAERDDAGE